MTIIKVENLSKDYRLQVRDEGMLGAFRGLFNRKYEIKKAVKDISLQINEGEIVGYLGPNGAGKSTTIKMLSGILVPSSGKLEVNGIVPYQNRKEHAKRIGVVFGQRSQLWWDIPVSESLNLMKYMYNIPENQYRENIKTFQDYLNIDEFIQVPVRQLSLGQRMRADLCAALLHNPDILFLDEPTIGLDVVVKEKIRQFIKQINQERKTTVILTTHDMSDIEKLCHRVIVIDKGQMIYDGQLEQLKATYGSDETMIVETEEVVNEINSLYALGVTAINQEGTKLFITYNKNHINSTAVIGLLLEKYKVVDFIIRETDIEEVIRKMYNGAPQIAANGGAYAL
ncbi:ABC transporter ATP-binding protein [Halalkalibacter urbisdiaboli]|uniref:ABC transporter ATP-binding protein n=1 Tax=Halalkalibacter urbisdiaboli TaxID=1960589 RepID=UPI000B43B18F|nr:ABC transporter ATP-binding protein [Halalkalibacter urbisdiaboli]